MNLLGELRNGTFGVCFDAPAQYEVTRDEPRYAMLVDRARGLALTLHLDDVAIDTRPANDELWRADVELHARALFDRCFVQTPRPDGIRPEAPRTADETWSPVIEAGRVRVGAVEGLTVVHRLNYEPGLETIMAHLLVPLDGRSFELRLVHNVRETGWRESALLLKERSVAPDEDPVAQMRRLGQRHYDDPAFDAAFERHPLSQVRAALREIVEGGRVVVSQEPPMPSGPLELEEVDEVIALPDRYARVVGQPGARVARFSRVAFACTDGVRWLTLLHLGELRAGPGAPALVALGEAFVRETLPPGATEVQVSSRALPDAEGGPQAETVLAYTTDHACHTVYRWLTRTGGTVLCVAAHCEARLPLEALRADVATVVDSLRPLEAAAPAKKWWKFW